MTDVPRYRIRAKGPAFSRLQCWIVGFATLVIGLLCIITAGAWIGRKHLGFPLSAEEFTRNLNWVRTVLRLSGRQRANRR